MIPAAASSDLDSPGPRGSHESRLRSSEQSHWPGRITDCGTSRQLEVRLGRGEAAALTEQLTLAEPA